MEEIERLFKTAIEEIERLLNTKTVVGEPIVIEGKTLIPLVSLGFGFGAGGGTGKAPKSKADKAVEGLGGGTGKAPKSKADKAVEGLGGGTGGGGGVKPVAIIVVDEAGVRLEAVKGGTSTVLEKVVDAFAAKRKQKEEAAEE